MSTTDPTSNSAGAGTKSSLKPGDSVVGFKPGDSVSGYKPGDSIAGMKLGDSISGIVVVTDENLLRDHLAGDKRAFTSLVKRYERELYHFLVRFLGDRAAAEDVFQEAFLQVHESAATFDLTRRFRPWLFTIAANKARDLLRSKSRHPASPLDASPDGFGGEGQYIDLLQAAVTLPDEPIQKEELRRLVHRTIQELPPNLREVLLLGYFHEFPYKQIGEMLKIPVGTVKSRLHAAVAHFAGRWDQYQRRHGR